jgi:hypothetical protein
VQYVLDDLTDAKNDLTHETLIHLTSIAILLTDIISGQEKIAGKHSQVFARDYVDDIEDRLTKLERHDLNECAQKRQLTQISQASGSCRRCRCIYTWSCSLRFHQTRQDLFYACVRSGNIGRTTLLCTMVNCYLNLRSIIKTYFNNPKVKPGDDDKPGEDDVDSYLFLQVAFALIQLHKQEYIWLTFQSVERYFIIFSLYFTHYYTDHIHYVDWDDIYESLLKYHWLELKKFQKIYWMLPAFLFTREHVIANKYLFLDQSTAVWNDFVRQINEHPEVRVLRQHYHLEALFPLQVEETLEDDEDEILTFRK